MRNMEKKTQGLKSFTKPHSVPVRLKKGGKEYIVDNFKQRKYKIKGEK